MKTVNVTFRVDEDVKKQADALFADLGMSLSTAFNIFLRHTLAALEAAKKGEDLHGPYDTVAELMEALNA